MKTFVIGEVGSCHDGDIQKGLQLIEAARDAGCDAVKFQYWSDPNRLADRRRVPEHYRAIYRRYQLIPTWFPELVAACTPGMGVRPIEFMCSTYIPEDVATVAPFVTRFKVASFEAEDGDLLWAHLPFLGQRKVIVSLGMNASAAPALVALGNGVDFLRCVSAYPAPVDALNLHLLRDSCYDGLKYSGLSDHTNPALTWTGALAVAAGARIIEAHLKLEETDPQNPDAPHAMRPRVFADYVRHIRFAEACVGDGEPRLQPCEEDMARYRVRSS